MEFEGPEKKLEIHARAGFGSLRELGEAFWEDIVTASRASILSTLRGPSCDAYLLSESSLFVYPDRMTMITCGETTLAAAALRLIERLGAENIAFLCYERKNELYPERQSTSFTDDADALEHALGGGTRTRFGDPAGNNVSVFFREHGYLPDPRDTTLEVLMHGIGMRALASFGRGPGEAAKAELRRDTGIGRILSGFSVDDHLFAPRGYSLNAVQGDWYYTVHVSPDPGSAYASFETNYHLLENGGERTLERITSRLIEVFQPESFALLLFHRAPRLASAGQSYELRHELTCALGASYKVLFQDYRRKA